VASAPQRTSIGRVVHASLSRGADEMSASVKRVTFSVSIDKYRAYHSLTTAALDESLGDNVLIMLNL